MKKVARKKYGGKVCAEGHRIVGDNAMLVAKGKPFLRCRKCWNEYQRTYEKARNGRVGRRLTELESVLVELVTANAHLLVGGQAFADDVLRRLWPEKLADQGQASHAKEAGS